MTVPIFKLKKFIFLIKKNVDFNFKCDNNSYIVLYQNILILQGGIMPNINLLRIDNRLIHGQVATSWVQHSNSNLLVVPNDSVCNDKMRQTLMDMAAPQGIGTRYFSIQKTIEIIDKASPKQFIALIVETPQDALRLIEGGIKVEKINIGNMHMSQGKKQISKAVCVDEDDVMAFKKLAALGIKLEVQRVPTESMENLLDLI